VFISHTPRTRDLAASVVQSLAATGIDALDVADGQPGASWFHGTSARLRRATDLLALLSNDWSTDPYRFAELSMAVSGRMRGRIGTIIPVVVDRGTDPPPILNPHQPVDVSSADDLASEVASVVAARLRNARQEGFADPAAEISQLWTAARMLSAAQLGTRRSYAAIAHRTAATGLLVGITGAAASIGAVVGSTGIGGSGVAVLGGTLAGLVAAGVIYHLALLRLRPHIGGSARPADRRDDDHAA
jgi:hypothetical protein